MKKQFIFLAMLLPAFTIALPGAAQLNPFASGYFQNQYLFNPAMSGVKAKEFAAGAVYSKQGNVPNAPASVSLTGNYGFSESGGVGLNVFYDKAGIQNTVKIMGTYHYSLQLNDENERLHFGLSLGGVQQRLNTRDVTGDPNDPLIYNYNDQDMKFESDFGVAYAGKKLTVQAAFPNMIAQFSKSSDRNYANRATFFTAASYKFGSDKEDGGVTVEPKIVYRGVYGSDNIIDAGANITALNNLVNVFGMYHSTKSVTIGAGVGIKKSIQALFTYSTQSSGFKSYSGGGFEVGLRFLFK